MQNHDDTVDECKSEQQSGAGGVNQQYHMPGLLKNINNRKIYEGKAFHDVCEQYTLYNSLNAQ
jgi:hypothetical protein